MNSNGATVKANNELKNALASKTDPQDNKTGAKANGDTIYTLIDRMKPEIKKVLPKHLDPDRIARIAQTIIRVTPKLGQCTPASLLGALMVSAQLGLEPGILGQCYLIPYWNKKLGTFECQFQIGYKGLLELLYRSGRVSNFSAHIVYDVDTFEYEEGFAPKLVHKPNFDKTGVPRLVYAYSIMKDGSKQAFVMSVQQVEAIRNRSKSPGEGPWVTDWEAMARKTAAKQLIKWLPVSPEVMRAIENDEGVKMLDNTVEIDGIVDMPLPIEMLGEGENAEPEQQSSSAAEQQQ